MQNNIFAKLVISFALVFTVSSGAWAQHGGGGHGGGGHGGGGGGSHGGGGHGGGGGGGSHGGGGHGGGGGGGSHGGGGGHPGGGGHAGVPAGYKNVGHGTLSGTKNVNHGGKVYTQRTFVNGHGHVNVLYANHSWGGHPYFCYHHWVGFNPWFWGWYYGPWVPWGYPWGWYNDPWYHDYWFWYFHPYPRYTSPGQWVTDWILADMLKAAYDRGVEEGESQVNTATADPVSDGVKGQLQAQVDELSKSYQGEQTVDLKETLVNPNYIYAVNQTFTETVVNSASTCKLAEGDLLKVAVAPTDANPVATMSVVSSKFGSCAAGTQIEVSVSDLQEMLNSFAERVDNGLHEFQKTKTKSADALSMKLL